MLDENGIIVGCTQCGQRNRIPYTHLASEVRCGKCKTEVALPTHPLELQSQAAFDALVSKSSIPVFIDFWAPWCGPCKMIAPEIEKLSAGANAQFVVAKLNTDEVPATAQQYQISAIPTMAVFLKGRELARTSGVRPAAGLRDFILQAIPR